MLPLPPHMKYKFLIVSKNYFLDVHGRGCDFSRVFLHYPQCVQLVMWIIQKMITLVWMMYRLILNHNCDHMELKSNHLLLIHVILLYMHHFHAVGLAIHPQPCLSFSSFLKCQTQNYCQGEIYKPWNDRLLSFLPLLRNNSNQEHVNSMDTDPLNYLQKIIEFLLFLSHSVPW